MLFIVLPFLVIGYIFSLSKEQILFTNEQYNNFTMESRVIVRTLQQNYERTFDLMLIFLLPILVSGVILIYNGLKEWKKFEDLDYEEKSLKLSEINKRTTKASSEKVEENIKNDLQLEQISENNLKIYQSIEDRVVRRIYESAPSKYKIVSNRILNTFLYDVIAMSQEVFDKDILFEIKYLSRRIDGNILNGFIRKVYELSNNYSIETNRIPYKKLILVVSDEFYIKNMTLLDKQEKINNLSIILLKETEIENTNFFN